MATISNEPFDIKSELIALDHLRTIESEGLEQMIKHRNDLQYQIDNRLYKIELINYKIKALDGKLKEIT